MNSNYQVGEDLRTIGVTVSDSVTLEDFPSTGRGVIALRDLHKGDVVVQATEANKSLVTPRFVITNYSDIRSFLTGVVKKGTNVHQLVDAFDVLTLWLLYEQDNEKSKFKPYLKSLPCRFSVPYCQPMEHWRLLPKQVEKQVHAENKALEIRYDNLIELHQKSLYAHKIHLLERLTWRRYSSGLLFWKKK